VSELIDTLKEYLRVFDWMAQTLPAGRGATPGVKARLRAVRKRAVDERFAILIRLGPLGKKVAKEVDGEG